MHIYPLLGQVSRHNVCKQTHSPMKHVVMRLVGQGTVTHFPVSGQMRGRNSSKVIRSWSTCQPKHAHPSLGYFGIFVLCSIRQSFS